MQNIVDIPLQADKAEQKYADRGIMRRAFTLVELLVVAGIAVILLGLLLGAVSATSRKAKAVSCAASLRTIGQGFEVYATDNAGFWPIAHANSTTAWFDQIALSLGIRSVNRDGNDPYAISRPENRNTPFWGCRNFENDRLMMNPLGYALNAFPQAPDLTLSVLRPPDRPVKPQKYTRPSERALIGETNPDKTIYPFSIVILRAYPTGIVTSLDPSRHGTAKKVGSNILFADHHVESVTDIMSLYKPFFEIQQ